MCQSATIADRGSLSQCWTPEIGRKIKDTLKSGVVLYGVVGTLMVTPVLSFVTSFTLLVPGTFLDFWANDFGRWWMLIFVSYWTCLLITSIILLLTKGVGGLRSFLPKGTSEEI